MENNREATVVYWSKYQDNGKENGNYYSENFAADSRANCSV